MSTSLESSASSYIGFDTEFVELLKVYRNPEAEENY